MDFRQPITQAQFEAATEHKHAEERLLRLLDSYKTDPRVEPRWLALARTHFEIAYMALNRAVFRPERVTLPEDAESSVEQPPSPDTQQLPSPK